MIALTHFRFTNCEFSSPIDCLQCQFWEPLRSPSNFLPKLAIGGRIIATDTE